MDRSFRSEIKYSSAGARPVITKWRKKNTAPPLLEERVAPREHRVGEKRREEKKKEKGGGKEGENRLEEELPEITENVERMKGGGRGKPVFEARVEKGRELACPGASSF